jgi:hypothetical protein
VTQTSSRNLSARLIGPDAVLRDVIIIGGITGAAAGIGPMFELQPLVFFLPAGWFLYSVARVFGLLVYPRRGTLPFVLGLPYGRRLALTIRFVERKGAELAAVCGVSCAAFFLTRGIVYRSLAGSETLNMLAIMLGEAVVFQGSLFVAVRFSLLRPIRRDEHRFLIRTHRNFSFERRLGLFVIRLARLGSLPFSNESRIIAQRLLLYLLRNNFAGLAFFSAAALVVSLLIAGMLRDGQGFASGLVILAASLAAVFEMTGTMCEAGLRIRLCPYYSFGNAGVLFVNFAFATAAMIPFALIYAVKMLFLEGPVHAAALFRLAAFALSCAATGLALSLAWTSGAWTSISVSGIALALLCSLVGLAVPYYGPILPLAACIVLWAVGRK